MKIASAKTFGGERYLVESDIEEFVLSSDVRLIVEEAIESAVVSVDIDSSITSDGLNPVTGSAIYAALGEKVGMSEFEALAGSVVSSEDGKQLSEEDFTSALKDKLESVASGATRVVDSTVADWGYTKITSANVSTIVNGIIPSGIMTSSVFASGEGVVKSAVNATNAVSAQTAANVKDGKITIKLNGTNVNSFTVNQSTDSTVDISGVALANDLNGYANAMVVTMDTDSYVLSMSLKNGDTVLSTSSIDLPLETMVVSGFYDSGTKKINLGLKNGSTVSFPVGALVDGLVPDTRTVNGKALDGNINVYVSDIHVSNGGDTLTQVIEAITTSISNISTTVETLGIGDMTIESFVSGDGVVKSAANADSATSAASAGNATTVNGHTVSANVPANAVFTDTIPGSGVLTVSNQAAGSSVSFSADSTSNATMVIPSATSTVYGLAKVETVVSNTSNAVANKVVSAISSTMNAHIGSDAVHVPATGTTGYYLKKTENGTEWAEVAQTTVASSIESDGANPVAGSAMYSALASKVDIVDLAHVAFTGNYNDLTNIPETFQITIDSTVEQNGVNAVAGSAVYAHVSNAIASIPEGTSTTLGLTRVEQVVSNTSNAVANKVVSAISSTMNAHITNSRAHVPDGGTSGQVLKRGANNTIEWGTDLTVGGSAVLPTYSAGDADKILQVKANGEGTEWVAKPTIGSALVRVQAGGQDIASFGLNDTASTVVNISSATSTKFGVVKVETVVSNTFNAVANSVVSGISSTMNAHITSSKAHVPTFSAGDSGKVLRMNAAGTSATWSAMPTVGSATITLKAGGTSYGTINVNETSNTSVNIPMATSSVAGVVKIDSVIANTSNAVANSAVYLMSSSFSEQLANIPDGFEKVSTLPTMNAGTVGKLYFVTTENKFYVGTANGNPTADLIGHFSPDYVGDGINSHIFAYQSGAGDSRRWSVMESAAGTDLRYNSESGQWRITTLFWDSPYDEGTSYYYATAPSGSNPWDAGLQWRLYGNGTDIALNGSTNYFENNSMSYGYANVGGGDGDMARSDFVTGNSSVASAGNATTVNGHTVSTNVPAGAVFTDTIPGSAVITLKAGGSTVGSFSVNASSNTSVSIPSATSTVYGVAKVETVVSNTFNAVANSVVYSLSGIVSNVSSSVNVLTQTIGTLGTSYATAEYVSSAIASKVDIVDLSHVAFTGSYEDLTDKPTALAGGWNWHSMTIPSTSSSYSLTVNVEKKVNGVWSSVDVSGRVKYWTGTDFVTLTSAGLPATLAGYKAFVLLGDIVARDTECRSNWHIVGHGANDDSDWQGFIW